MKIEQSSQLYANVPQSDPSIVGFDKEKEDGNRKRGSSLNNSIILGIIVVIILASFLFFLIKVNNQNQKECLKKGQPVSIATNDKEGDEKQLKNKAEPPLVQAPQKERDNPSTQMMIEALDKSKKAKNKKIDELTNELQQINKKLKQNEDKLRASEELVQRNNQKIKDLQKKAEQANNQLKKKDQTIKSLQKKVNSQLNNIQNNKEYVLNLEQKLQTQQKQNKEKLKALEQKIEKQMKQKKNQIQLLQKQLQDFKKKSEKKVQNKDQKKQITQVKKEVSEITPQKPVSGVLYTEQQLSAKHKLQQQRKSFSSKKQKQYDGFKMIALNHQLHSPQKSNQNLYFGHDKLIKQHKKENEAQFCIIIPNYLNLSTCYYEYTFNSIFNQNYTNYKIVIFGSKNSKVNDFIRKYLSIKKIQQNKYVFVETHSQKTPTENVHMGIHHYCEPDSLAMVIQGGDQLLGREVFTIYNGIFQNEPVGVVFTNNFQVKHNDYINWGGTSQYTDQQINQKSFRKIERTKFQLLAFKTELYKAVNITDLKDNGGQYFETVLTSIFFPLSEVACGRVKKAMGVFYIQNIDQKHQIRALRQKMIFKAIQKRQKYECEPIFKKTMDDLGRYPKQLNDISKKRVQKSGMIAVPKGTVTQIDLLAKNPKGQRIEDVICKDQGCKDARVKFHNRRLKFIQKNITNMIGLELIKYNLKYDNSMDSQQKIDEQKQYRRLDQIYHFDKYRQQLPFCLIVCSLNNNVQSRIQYNLNSIFTQNYTNYFVIIFNDASWDGSDQIYRKYLNFHNISKDKYVYIQNKKRKTALENLHIATYDYCSDDSITLLVDGDDELIGRNVIKVFNVAHQKLKGGVIYSNYIVYNIDRRLERGISKSYTQKQKDQLLFRSAQVKYSHVRTHVTALWKTLDKTVYQDEAGDFYKATYDFATYIPMMEHACGRVYYIGNLFYLYNVMTGLNDGWVNYGGQIDVVYKVRAKPKLECLPQYKALPMYDDANLSY